MKLKYEFEIVDMGEEKVAVPVGKGAENLQGVLKLNKQGFEVFSQIQEGKTTNEIISSICEKYDDDIQTITSYVEGFISKLIKIEIIE